MEALPGEYGWAAVPTTIYFMGGAELTIKESAKALQRKLDDTSIVEVTDAEGHVVHIRRGSVAYWLERGKPSKD